MESIVYVQKMLYVWEELFVCERVRRNQLRAKLAVIFVG
jgi:hypothetical protein